MPPASNPGRYAMPHTPALPDPRADETKVLKFGDDSPYSVQATLEWGSLEDFQKAASDQDALNAIMGDVKNFSNTTPKLMTGEIVGSQ